MCTQAAPGVCQAPVGPIEHEEHDGCRAAQAAQLQVGNGQPGLGGLQPKHCTQHRCAVLCQVLSCFPASGQKVVGQQPATSKQGQLAPGCSSGMWQIQGCLSSPVCRLFPMKASTTRIRAVKQEVAHVRRANRKISPGARRTRVEEPGCSIPEHHSHAQPTDEGHPQSAPNLCRCLCSQGRLA